MIIKCHVWCTGRSRREIDLGLPEGDSWLPFAVDFSIVNAIKLAGENDFLGNDKASIYFQGEVFTIDITFEKAIELWEKAKGLACD